LFVSADGGRIVSTIDLGTKSAPVTDAATGIGEAVAERLAGVGAR
jgi:NAD(P)-dependent dehydrogenase (short-subunit alcohol dehydrogenase family)